MKVRLSLITSFLTTNCHTCPIKGCWLYTLAFTAILFLHSCLAIYGIKKHPVTDNTEQQQLDKKLAIVPQAKFDTTTVRALKELHLSKDLEKDLTQPLQFWVIENDHVLANKVNCYAGGFPNLKWGIQSCYATQTVYSAIKKGAPQPAISQYFDINKDTTVIVVYAHYMGWQNNRFISECQHFISRHPNFRYKFINFDKLMH